MKGKLLLVSSASLLAIAAIVIIPTASQGKGPAKPKPIIWKGQCPEGGNGEGTGEKIKGKGGKEEERKKCQTISWGTLTFTVTNPALEAEITCKKSDAGNIWNSEEIKGFEDGRDETVLLNFYECHSKGSELCNTVAINALKLPWQSALSGSSPVIYDEISGVELEFACGSPGNQFKFTVKGTLIPKMVNGAPTVFEEFTAAAGTLSGTSSAGPVEVTVTGKDYNLGFGKGEKLKVAF